jgi:hypothetical protein
MPDGIQQRSCDLSGCGTPRPPFRRFARLLFRYRLEEKPSDGNLDLLCLDSQGHSSFSPDLQAGGDRLADIVQRFFTALALTDTTGYQAAGASDRLKSGA